MNKEETKLIKGQVEHCLLGKLLSSRNISKVALKNALTGAWKTRDFSIEFLTETFFPSNSKVKMTEIGYFRMGPGSSIKVFSY